MLLKIDTMTRISICSVLLKNKKQVHVCWNYYYNIQWQEIKVAVNILNRSLIFIIFDYSLAKLFTGVRLFQLLLFLNRERQNGTLGNTCCLFQVTIENYWETKKTLRRKFRFICFFVSFKINISSGLYLAQTCCMQSNWNN